MLQTTVRKFLRKNSKIFSDPSCSLKNSSPGSREGAGPAFLLVKCFVEMQGGEVWVKSELGKGSIFTFSIPIIGEVDAYIP
ncbi:MAG: ATP-binding protein [Euryarchaeota archaeon]|nr:ATP-binding protein [Euryarchaeota archaeon]